MTRSRTISGTAQTARTPAWTMRARKSGGTSIPGSASTSSAVTGLRRATARPCAPAPAVTSAPEGKLG